MEVASLTEKEYDDLNIGVNVLRRGRTSTLVYKSPSGELRACENVCKHQGGIFVKDIEDSESCILTCNRHQWKLDVSSMEYVNPPDMHKQTELEVRRQPGNGVVFVKNIPPKSWDDVQEYLPLAPGELTVTYMTHACMEIKLGDKTIITDPWLQGPAFLRGWWLQHEPPKDIWERLMHCDAIWFSHSHTDHLSLPTLTDLVKLRKDVPIYVGDLRRPVIRPDIQDLGFTNINVIPIETWTQFGQGRFMINDDDTLPDVDSWILFEYKGHRICNFVDCSSPSALVLPDKQVDLILTDFASGASGFPSCFVDLHGEEKVIQIANAKRATVLRKAVDIAKKTKAKAYVPVAGYFVMSHPNDSDIQHLNKQNTADEAIAYMQKFCPLIKTWKPFPGGTFDVSTLSGSAFPASGDKSFLKTSWDHDLYVKPLLVLGSRCLTTLNDIQMYFDWADFHSYNLLLHVREMDDTLKQQVREFWVDFAGKKAVVSASKPREGHMFCMRVRMTSFRVVCHRGDSWDDIFIGFQGRYSVVPDLYHFKFLNHFSNGLPQMPPFLPL